MRIQDTFDPEEYKHVTSGFRDWDFIGMIPIRPWDAHCFGIDGPGDSNYVAVYGKRHSVIVESDDVEKEENQLAEGCTSIVLFRGIDNYSAMRRMLPEEYDATVLSCYRHRDDDLYYNS